MDTASASGAEDSGFESPVGLVAVYATVYLMFNVEVPEWLRGWAANLLCSARVGSNPILDGIFFLFAITSLVA